LRTVGRSQSLLGVTTDLERQLARHVHGLPPPEPLFTTWTDLTVTGFRCAAGQAVAWWQRLRAAHEAVRHWPVLLDPDAPSYFTERDAAARGDNDAAALSELLDKASRLDGQQLLAEWGRRRLEVFGEEVARHARDELHGRGVWPSGPRRQPKLLYSLARGDTREVLVALVPAQAPWEIPAVIGYGGWNRYPDPEDHVAILRYWNDRYGAELVAMTGTTVELTVRRPPRTRPQALALAWEYFVYNDGYYDYYGAEDITQLAAGLLGADTWIAWWD
jgi:Domain of unknown function (DUF4253)